MTRDTAARAADMRQKSPVADIRSRIRECETLGEVRAWLAEYNRLKDQLPPRKQDLQKTIADQAERVRERGDS